MVSCLFTFVSCFFTLGGRYGIGGAGGLNGGFEPPEPQMADQISQTKRKLPVSTEDLRKAWAVSRRISKDDWLEWYGGLCREFLKASPSPALRACWTVAQRYALTVFENSDKILTFVVMS